MIIIPKKLTSGDHIRVIAPSRSINIVSQECRDIAVVRLQELGLTVSFGANVAAEEQRGTASIQERVIDLHEAFADKNVQGILTVIGGFSANQLLPHIDFDLIRENPKILCGYSDISILSNAIYAKTGMLTYSGPHFSSFGMKKHFDYTLEHFKKCLFSEEIIDLTPSSIWSEDPWFIDQDNRTIQNNTEGYVVYNHGKAEGTIMGGNLGTLHLLMGTEYFPDVLDTIIFVEDCFSGETNFPDEFDRLLESLTQQRGFERVRGIVLGRFESASRMPTNVIHDIISRKQALQGLPVIGNVDFGHTNPMITFPVGGKVIIDANTTKPQIIINTH